MARRDIMCGIAGVIHIGTREVADKDLVRRMTDAIAHRGPDASGVWSDGGVALGHRRLSIIDLDGRANQPLESPAGDGVITFNGEIYNYRELAQEVTRRGVSLRTRSDTEVLAALLDLDGEEALPRLNGMYAFVHYDRARRRVVAAVDRFGKKPFYYRLEPLDGGWRLSFASELKALLLEEPRPSALDPLALEWYLAFGAIPAPFTVFREVRRLEPGSVLTLTAEGPRVRRHFVPEARPAPVALRDAAARTLEALERAVERRLVADVPVGVFLSGGIDSSLVTLVASRVLPDVRTFTIGFGDAAMDESAEARETASAIGVAHEVRVLEDDFLPLVPELPFVYDEPFADASAIPTLLVSRVARRDVKVVLSGDAGDETFAGYNRYAFLRRYGGLTRLPRPARAAAGAAGAALARLAPKNRLAGRAARALDLAAHAASPRDAHVRALTGFGSGAPPPRDLRAVAEAWRDAPDAVSGATLADVRYFMTDDVLVKVDRASMRAALEVRCPFLDPGVFAVAAALPTSVKMQGGELKAVPKRILRDHGLGMVARRPKRGFGVPVDAWFRGALRSAFHDLVLSDDALSSTAGVERAAAARLAERHARGEALGNRLWNLLMLELSLRRLLRDERVTV